jgi:hypothetical protein
LVKAKEGTMAVTTVPRFKSREAALRFYFRAGELLAPNAKPGVFSSGRPSNAHNSPNAIEDFLTLDACFYGLNDVQLWLLHELYGPGGFILKPHPVAEVFASFQRKFPKNDWTPHQLTQFKKEALKIFEAHLVRERLL